MGFAVWQCGVTLAESNESQSNTAHTVVDLGAEGNFWRFEGVILREGNIQEEDTASVPVRSAGNVSHILTGYA